VKVFSNSCNHGVYTKFYEDFMNKEIITDSLEPEDLWQDLRNNINTLQDLGISHVSVLYGFSWGSHFYDNSRWEELLISIKEIEAPLHLAMEGGYGALGHDNLYISVPQFDLKLQYSHETDIHISYGDENELVQRILKRWKESGWLQYGKYSRK